MWRKKNPNAERIKALERLNVAFQKNKSLWGKNDDGKHLPWFEDLFKKSLHELFGKSPKNLNSYHDLGEFLLRFRNIEFYNTEYPTTQQLDEESNIWEKLHEKYYWHNENKAWSKHPELLRRGRPKKECEPVNGPSSAPTVGLWKRVN